MANSIDSGVNDVRVDRRAFAAFTKKLTPLNAFSTSFSDTAADPGATIKVLRETYPDQAVATKSSHTAYSVQDADSTTISMTLGQPIYVSYAVDDVDVASSSVVNIEAFAGGKGNHLANGVLQTVWDDITAANFGSAAFTGAASTFDIDDVYDIKDAMDDADVPEDNRSLVLSNAYATALLKDNTITNNPNAGDMPLRSGSLGRLAGFDIFTSNVVPDNSQNLVGFACHPSAFTVAMRYLAPQSGNTYERAEPMTDPESGITMGVRQWYDNSTGQKIRVYECVIASAIGHAAGLKRLVSA